MPIKVACQCGASFNAKDELAGKVVRCPKCKQPLKIPAPQPAPVANSALDDLFDEAGIDQKHGPTCPKCSAELKPNAVLCVACGFNMQTGESAEAAQTYDQLGGQEASADAVLEKAAKQIETDKEDDRKNKSTGAPAYVYLFGLLALVAFAAMMFTLPKGLAFFITGIAIVVFAQLINTYYSIRFIIVAFQESLAQGFLQFVPFYSIYYLITRWQKVGKIFMKMLGTLPLAFLGGCFMGLGMLLGFDYPDEKDAYRYDSRSIDVVQQTDASPRVG
ncbi:MAG: hypothetical protein CMJ64_18060 [Planctomycetaceae bacterium]|nr:hypothetical protein [Planctomycetaceae bacterium]